MKFNTPCLLLSIQDFVKALFISHAPHLKRKISKIVTSTNVDNKKIVRAGNKGVVCIEETHFALDDGYLIQK